MAERKKSVLRTIRLPADLAELLEKDAEAKRTSVNGLVTSILLRYAEWDRFADRIGFVSWPRHAFQRLLDATDEAALDAVAEEIGGEHGGEVTLFWAKKTSLEGFLDHLTLFARYTGIADVDVEVDGTRYTVTAHHDLGPRWTRFLRRLVEEELKHTAGIVPRTQVRENSLVLRFDALQPGAGGSHNVDLRDK